MGNGNSRPEVGEYLKEHPGASAIDVALALGIMSTQVRYSWEWKTRPTDNLQRRTQGRGGYYRGLTDHEREMKAAVYVLQLMEDEHDRLVNAQMRVQSAKMNEKRVRFQEMTAEEKREYAVALEAKKAVAIEAKKERDALKEKIDEARRQRNEARKQREEEARQREIEWALQKQKEAAAAEAEQRRIEAAWEAMRQASIRNEELIKDIKALKHSKTVCEIVKKHGMRLGDDPERLSSDFILGQIEETIRDKHKK